MYTEDKSHPVLGVEYAKNTPYTIDGRLARIDEIIEGHTRLDESENIRSAYFEFALTEEQVNSIGGPLTRQALEELLKDPNTSVKTVHIGGEASL